MCGVNRLAENVADDEIEVLVSVDLFSEGFDCPDVEFIQLARPTLSLAKYMQMVGRGLRVAKGKEYCVILDNVGLYKRFGLPSVDRDWQSMFAGSTSLEYILQETCLHVNSHNCRMDILMDGEEEMIKIINHERQQRMMMDSYGYSLVENGKKLYPRIRSKFIDEKAYLTVKTLELQVGTGLSWKRRFIPWDESNKVYYYKEGVNDLRLYYDDEGNYVAQENIGSPLKPIPSEAFKENFYHQCEERYEKEQAERKELERTAGHDGTFSSTKDLLENGRIAFKRGFVSLVKEGDFLLCGAGIQLQV